MGTQIISPEQLHATNLKTVIQSLVDQFNPLQIICFAKNSHHTQNSGCFMDQGGAYQNHYFLLMVFESVTRIEHEVQDYANKHYNDGIITILAHGKETIDHAISENNRFFITVCRTGRLLYSNNGMNQFYAVAPFIPTKAAVKAKKHFDHNIPLAEGFLMGAEDCMASQRYNACTFMLHQVVEQCCIALIRIHMGYRSEIHNLHRLLRLCNCFSAEPLKMILPDSAEDQRLFNLLMRSYSHARYTSNFSVSADDAKQLFNRVSAFAEFSKRNCLEKIEQLSMESTSYKQMKEGMEVEYAA
ncbi:MAG TPA: HEPN domain-containing protein [Pedobacter sp.]